MSVINVNPLLDFLRKVPSIGQTISTGVYEDNNWWIKLAIDIDSKLAWNVVQELGAIINYLSVTERLPAIFYPVSAPPYLNGGPKDYLYWIIESKQVDFAPSDLLAWLEGRLPNPVDSIEEWTVDE
jgi:hypothetical protein